MAIAIFDYIIIILVIFNFSVNIYLGVILDFFSGTSGKESPASARDMGSIPRKGRFPGVGNGTLWDYCLENSMGREAWWAIVHGAAKSRAQLNTYTHTHLRFLEEFAKVVQKEVPV